jgi:hypothetical protein
MANGRPGDHPLTDIVKHRLPMFGDEIDDHVRRLEGMVSNELRDVLATIVYFWPWGEKAPVDPHALSAILDSLQRYAEKQPRA